MVEGNKTRAKTRLTFSTSVVAIRNNKKKKKLLCSHLSLRRFTEGFFFRDERRLFNGQGPGGRGNKVTYSLVLY